jgi:hypothetical protein
VQLRNPIAGQIEQKLLLNPAMDIRLFEVGAPREAAPSPRKRRAMGAGATGSSSGSGALAGKRRVMSGGTRDGLEAAVEEP